MTADTIVSALGGRRYGSYSMAACPCHEDSSPSLSIKEKDGIILIHCHAGCPNEVVIAKLRDLGLWESKHSKTFGSGRSRLGRIVCTYDYVDEQGTLLTQVVRYEPKSFRQRRPDGHGGWIWRASDRHVLYRLPEVLRSPIILLAEGERDVETLRDHGFISTTNISGAGDAKNKWRPEYTTALASKEVVLLPDNDRAGWERVITIARALISVVVRLSIVELVGGKDVTDWFGNGHSETELMNLIACAEVIR